MDFNDLFILECFKHKEDKQFFDLFTIPSLKDFNLSTRYQFLKKNEYLVEDPNDTSRLILSVKGQDFLNEISLPDAVYDARENTTISVKIIDFSKTPDESFEEWWKLFPTTPAWTSVDKKVSFTGSRSLKNLKKADAKKRYLKLLNQGLKHEELLGSLKYEIKLKRVDSLKKNANQMEYFKGMESYLNQERYLLFIDNFKDNPDFVKDVEIKSKKQNVTDI
jgi:hypothetical protein